MVLLLNCIIIFYINTNMDIDHFYSLTLLVGIPNAAHNIYSNTYVGTCIAYFMGLNKNPTKFWGE